MPLKRVSRKASAKTKKAVLKGNFHELRHGKTYGKTSKKFGKTRARKQMIAIALKSVGASRRRKRSR